MCKVHRKLYDASSKFPSKSVPKLLPEALQIHPQKKRVTETPKNRKKSRKLASQGGPRMWFSDILGLLGTPGGHHGSQTSPQGPPDSSEP